MHLLQLEVIRAQGEVEARAPFCAASLGETRANSLLISRTVRYQ